MCVVSFLSFSVSLSFKTERQRERGIQSDTHTHIYIYLVIISPKHSLLFAEPGEERAKKHNKDGEHMFFGLEL